MGFIAQLLLLYRALGIFGLATNEFVIPGWDIQSVKKAGNDLMHLSTVAYDSSSWHQAPARSTVFAGLISDGIFNDKQLFFSTNLEDTVDYQPYNSPWLYRATFALDTRNNSHFFLQTNGITSKADIYLNGHEVVDKSVQAGAYGGRTYDVTALAHDQNALLIKAYPTDYNKDFALGFVDWNPYPPDNGTGVWRDVSIKCTGSVAMSALRITTDYLPGATSVTVTLKTDATNLESSSVSGMMKGFVVDVNGSKIHSNQQFKLAPSETKTVAMTIKLDQPMVWWPKQWGDQPLYTAQTTLSVEGEDSDSSGETTFGIRHITSHLNEHNDTMFTVNGHPFQVRGGGYSPDMFLRWDTELFELQAKYVLDMGLNTIRLEGKEEQPELFDVADRLGLMVMPGWECCDKWEAWTYNDEITRADKFVWNDDGYRTANASMRHEAAMLQTHPSVLAFLIGSDYWPDNRAAAIYVAALQSFDWPNPIICSAGMLGYPEILGPSGLKMNGPYDWVPPNYWYYNDAASKHYNKSGAAFGLGSELGAGVGTPEIGSLRQFLTDDELETLWTKPDAPVYHMSPNSPVFNTRRIYNDALYHRYGKPKDLNDYLLKAQMMDYEATRAEFEAFQANWNAERPATGLIYWMLNNAWPSLHWNLFDYYLHPAGSYFGTKTGSRIETVAYNYDEGSIYLINHSLTAKGSRTVDIELIDTTGKSLANKTTHVSTTPNTSKSITSVPGRDKIKNVAFLRLILSDSQGVVLSRNVYWLSHSKDELIWHKSTWYTTPVSSYADFTALETLRPASVSATVGKSAVAGDTTITLHNRADVPAVFIRLNLVDAQGLDVTPVVWSDNYVTLWPNETLELQVSAAGDSGDVVEVSGRNIAAMKVSLN